MRDRLVGIMLGTAVGDALGLPAEGLRPARRRRMWPGAWQHRLLLSRGMLSDDSEHTLFVAQALLEHPKAPERFQRYLAWRFRWWLLGLPAGIGRATLRACVKLWLGFSPARSGVYSAGNGPAMRVALIGGYFHDDDERMRRFVQASTELTHTDPKANVGALAVARLAAWAVEHHSSQQPEAEILAKLLTSLAPEDADWQALVESMRNAYLTGRSVPEYAALIGLGKGVTGYVYHTVPVAVYAWLRHYGNLRKTVEAALDCGGDTDTVGAIAGALAGATTGSAAIPPEWLEGICDLPRSVALLRRVAERLAEQKAEGHALGALRYCWPLVLPRNVLFLAVVLVHGFRRLLPPY